MVYTPLVDGIVDYSKIDGRSAGYSILKNRNWIKYGIAGLTGAHQEGHWNLTPCIGANVKRIKNEFEVTEFINQRPTSNSRGFNWEAGQSPDKTDILQEWQRFGLKPMYESILEDMKVLLPEVKSLEGLRASLIRSEDDLKSYAKNDLLKKTVLTSFLSFPNVTGDSFDTYYIPTFFKGKLPSSFNVDTLSQSINGNGIDGDGKQTVMNFKVNGRMEIDFLPIPELERFIAPKRQNKAMWNFIEDLFGIDADYAPMDLIHLSSQFEAAKTFSDFVFDQIVSFDQKPVVGNIDIPNYITMQLIRLTAFNYIKQRCPAEAWMTKCKVLVRHPMISEAEFEQSMEILDKYWNAGTFERVPAAGEGLIDLNILPIGDDKVIPNGFRTPVPCFNISEIPTPLAKKDYDDAQKITVLNFAKSPRIVSSKIPGRILTWDRLTGIDGLMDGEYSSIAINLITPTSVKQIVPNLNSNQSTLDRFDQGMWPILVQVRVDDEYLAGKIFPSSEFDEVIMPSDVGAYSLGLVSAFKGPLYAFDVERVKTSKDNIGFSYKQFNEETHKVEVIKGTASRLSIFPRK